MSTFLFDDLIFGPIHSRRLGLSLGINLLPITAKFCNFNCVYCECGLTYPISSGNRHLPNDKEIYERLCAVLKEYTSQEKKIDSITFAGNGEPTLHPHFAKIVDLTIQARSQWMPDCRISVLTNATRLNSKSIQEALLKVDVCMFKLDAGTEELYQAINQNIERTTLTEIKNSLKNFKKKVILQSLFLKSQNNPLLNNTTEKELNAWLETIRDINPEKVVLYSIDRDVPTDGLIKIEKEILESIADRVRLLKILAEVY